MTQPYFTSLFFKNQALFCILNSIICDRQLFLCCRSFFVLPFFACFCVHTDLFFPSICLRAVLGSPQIERTRPFSLLHRTVDKFRLRHQSKQRKGFRVFCAGGDEIDSGRLNRGVSQYIGQFSHIPAHLIECPGKEMSQVVGKHL